LLRATRHTVAPADDLKHVEAVPDAGRQKLEQPFKPSSPNLGSDALQQQDPVSSSRSVAPIESFWVLRTGIRIHTDERHELVSANTDFFPAGTHTLSRRSIRQQSL